MPFLRFHKMHGAGNDFVLLDALQSPLPANFDFTHAAIQICARKWGVGSDGLLLLEPSNHANWQMRMWNPDGTEDMCGNGLRCASALAWRLRHVQNPNFTVETLAGVRQVRRLEGGEFECEMGAPDFSPQAIPANSSDELVDFSLEVEGKTLPCATSVSTGSTHTVVFLERELSESEFQFWGPKIELHPLFPDRTSIMFALPTGKNEFQIRIWERGVGETLACGTGASAVAASAWKTGRANGEVAVQSRGGTLRAREVGGKIWLSGPTQYLFEGVFSL